MADGTRLSQMQKEIDLIGSELPEIKSQIRALETNINNLIKDKGINSKQEENHRERQGENHRERERDNISIRKKVMEVTGSLILE
jgi:hypothetical protein